MRINKVKIRNLALELRPSSEFWEGQAKCKGQDVNLMVYPSDEPTERQRKKLTELCSECPVIMDCRLEGLRTLSDGWWGGMTPQERFVWAATELFAGQLQ